MADTIQIRRSAANGTYPSLAAGEMAYSDALPEQIAVGKVGGGNDIIGTPEGTAIKSTGEAGGTKYLREDGDGTCSWQTIAGGGDALTTNPLSQFAQTTSLQLKNTISDETGSGALVFATSPTLVTPILGTPTSGTMTNVSGTAASLTAGTATAANGIKTATTTVSVHLADAPSAGQVLKATSSTVGTWQTLVQSDVTTSFNAQTGTAYTGVLSDAGKVITMTNAAANTFTIPAESSVNYPIGTQIHIKQGGAGATTVAITTDTLNVNANLTKVLNGRYAYATCIKEASAVWTIFGNLVAA